MLWLAFKEGLTALCHEMGIQRLTSQFEQDERVKVSAGLVGNSSSSGFPIRQSCVDAGDDPWGGAMRAFLIISIAGATATLAVATAASPRTDLIDGFVRSAIVGKGDAPPEQPAPPDSEYVAYSGYAAALPGPSCYWVRTPIYDSNRNVIGWRGRPLAVCP